MKSRSVTSATIEKQNAAVTEKEYMWWHPSGRGRNASTIRVIATGYRISRTGEEMLIMASSPVFARASEASAKTAIHLSRETFGTMVEKYCPQDDRRPTHVLKQARMNIAAMRNLPVLQALQVRPFW